MYQALAGFDFNIESGSSGGNENGDASAALYETVDMAVPCREAATKFDKVVFASTDCGVIAAREDMFAAANQSITKKKDLERFARDVAAFEKRIIDEGFSPSEAIESYKQETRLLSAARESAVPPEQCARIAQQAMSQAAKPFSTDQGRHNSCLAQGVEIRAYARKPSGAIKVVADTALHNKFVLKDGTEINLDPGSLEPDEESRLNPTVDGQRSYASHLFVMVANNAHWLRQTKDLWDRQIPLGSYRFAQTPQKRGDRFNTSGGYFDFGERIVDMEKLVTVGERPYVSWAATEDIYNQLMHTNDKGFVVDNRAMSTENARLVSSPEELESAVAAMESEKMLPGMIRFYVRPSANDIDGEGSWHSVNIVGFEKPSGKIRISDQYGESTDRSMSARDIFERTKIKKQPV